MSYRIQEDWLNLLNLRRIDDQLNGYEIVIPERCNIAYNTVERNAKEHPDNLALIFEDDGIEKIAELARQHNNANILVLGERLIELSVAKQCDKKFFLYFERRVLILEVFDSSKFDVVIVETVGVGQIELDIVDCVDCLIYP